jgi:chromosome segregation ATPase
MKTETTQLLNAALEILENARCVEEYKQELEQLQQELKDVYNENANLRQEIINFQSLHKTNEACIQNQHAHIKDLTADRDQWKANHDNQVKLKSILIQRPDLKDRSERISELISKLDVARRALLTAINYGDMSVLPSCCDVDDWDEAYQSSCYLPKK